MPEIYLEQLANGAWQRVICRPDAPTKYHPCDPLNELIRLTETKLSFLPKAMKELQAEVQPLMLVPRRVEPERFIAFRNHVTRLYDQLQKKNRLLGSLARAYMEEDEAFYILDDYFDRYYLLENGQPEVLDEACDEDWYVDAVDLLSSMKRAASLPGNVLRAHIAAEMFLEDSDRPSGIPSPITLSCEFSQLFGRPFFGAGNYPDGLQRRYSFHTPYDYYRFLIILSGESVRTVCRCAYCGKLFVPSSGNNTKYCDRVQPGGKRCKDLGPSATHRKNARQDPVLETFYRVKRRMYKRMERTLESRRTPTASLELDEYFAWLDAAEESRNQYQAGQLTKEAALLRLDPGTATNAPAPTGITNAS